MRFVDYLGLTVLIAVVVLGFVWLSSWGGGLTKIGELEESLVHQYKWGRKGRWAFAIVFLLAIFAIAAMRWFLRFGWYDSVMKLQK